MLLHACTLILLLYAVHFDINFVFHKSSPVQPGEELYSVYQNLNSEVSSYTVCVCGVSY